VCGGERLSSENKKKMNGKEEGNVEQPVAEIRNCVGDVTHSVALHTCNFNESTEKTFPV
jgi:hypothetical protein